MGAGTAGLSLESAKSISDMRRYMLDKHGIYLASNLDRLDFETVRQGVAGVEDVLRELPQLAGQIDVINADSGTSAYAYAMARSRDGKLEYQLYMSGWAYGDGDQVAKSLARDGSFHPPNTSARSIMSHEVGHIAEYTLAAKQAEELGTGARGAIGVMKKRKVATDIVAAACKKVKKTPYGKGKKNNELVAAISGYASRNRSETLAECVSDYMANGKASNPLSQAVWGILKEKLG